MNSPMGKYARKGLAVLLALVMIFPVFSVQSNAYSVDYTLPESELPSLELGEAPDATLGATFDNTTGDGGEDWISMTNARTFEVMIPVEISTEEAITVIAAEDFKWKLSRTEPYLNPDLYPNYKKGGDLAEWKDGSGKNALFPNTTTSAVQIEDMVYLKLEMDCISYYSDGSVPHSTATRTMDYIGWYSLAAVQGETTFGSVAAKVVPYDHFRTMGEVYDEIEELADYDTDLYVEEFSMGKSQCGFDMPYLIVARDEAVVDHWLELCERTETEPDKVLAELYTDTIGEYQVPVMFSNIHSNETAATDSILDFAWMLLEEKTIDYDVLTDFTEAGEDQLAVEMGTPGEEGSLAIPELVEDTATYLGYLTVDNYNINSDTGAKIPYSGPIDLSTYYDMDTETVDVGDLLDDVFFILVPEENVEGRIYMSRVSSGGLDLNRDNSFQTQNETQNMQRLIGTYNPVSLTELHGRVTTFQCEPCDPPHEPNFEYDLLARHLMPGGEAFGIAAAANNEGYNSYVIPQRDYLQYTGETSEETYWGDPWDDMSTSYTPQFAMLHGCVGYTVELPAYNDETAKAAAYGQLGQSDYVAANKEGYLRMQAEIFKRGINNANSNDYDLVGQWFCDQYDVEGAEAGLFRPEYDGEGENGNFYPECYIIPLDRNHQSNLQAAYDMMKWLSRNDVKVLLSEQAFTYEGKTYPAGTMIVPMYQAKRSVANGALYDGTLIRDWTILYSEGITTFNETRGFNMATCTKPDAYQTIKAVCGEPLDYEDCLTYLAAATSSLAGDRTGYQVIISNASEDSTAAVNELLQNGKTVGMITEGNYRGDYICSYADWLTVCDDFILTGTCISRNYPAAEIITKSPVIFINGKPGDSSNGYVNDSLLRAYNYNYDRQAMDLMNFKTTTDLSEADIIIGGSALDTAALTAVQAGTPYIGYGSGATRTTALNKFFDGVNRDSVVGSMDALAFVTYSAVNLINASYVVDGDDVMYGYGAGYFSDAPEGAEILVCIDGDREPTEGFLRALDDDGNPTTLNVFLDESIQGFSYEGEDKNGNDIDIAFFANSLTHKVHQRDEYAFISNFAFANMLDGKYTAAEYHSSSGSSKPKPSSTDPAGQEPTSGGAIKLAADTFTDVRTTDWFAESVGRMLTSNLMNGTTSTTFAPGAPFDRSMMAMTLYRMAGSPTVTESSPFDDVPDGAWYSNAVIWCASTGIVNGYNGSYGPSDPITREQVVAILYRYAKSIGLNVSVAESISGYTDRGDVSDFAAEAMNWAVANGIITGATDTTLNPKATATRAEVAAILMRAVDLFEK